MSSVSGNGAVAIANDCSSNCLLFLCRSPPTDLEIVTFTTFQNIGGMIMLYDTKLCGKRIQLLRKQKKLTQLQLAMRVNSTDKHIGGIEQGVRSASIDLLVEIAQEFHVSLDYLILGKTEIEKAELMLELDRLSKQIDRLRKML